MRGSSVDFVSFKQFFERAPFHTQRVLQHSGACTQPRRQSKTWRAPNQELSGTATRRAPCAPSLLSESARSATVSSAILVVLRGSVVSSCSSPSFSLTAHTGDSDPRVWETSSSSRLSLSPSTFVETWMYLPRSYRDDVHLPRPFSSLSPRT